METITKEKLKKLLKKLEDSMSAVAFAEAGEFETARSIIKERRKILLALTGKNSDTNAFRYAVNICNRIKADLEMLYVGEYEKTRLDYYKSQLENEGIEYNVIRGKGCIKDELLRYTDNKKEILFVVIESPDGLSINCKEEEHFIADSYKKLKCPLVVVSETART